MNALGPFFALALLAATLPLLPRADTAPVATTTSATDWPAELVSPAWTPHPLGDREARFARDFPGRIGVFTTPDGRTIVIRHVTQPTRKLHPAADCLRALGYTIKPGPIALQPDGTEWATLTATRDHERLQVRERLLGADGRRWTDLSAWYWSAALSQTSAPWWALTELTPLPTP